VRETCYRSYYVTLGEVPNMNIIHNILRLPNSLVSHQGGQSILNCRTSHNLHTHTGNTRQPKPQLKSSSCSSAILSHNSKDVIPNHNWRNATCLTPILSHNSRDTFWVTTQGTPASRPSRYHQSLVDHAHPKQAKHASRQPGGGHVSPGAKRL